MSGESGACGFVSFLGSGDAALRAIFSWRFVFSSLRDSLFAMGHSNPMSLVS
jgi:hypothetical protein